jgi:hypothetical protein
MSGLHPTGYNFAEHSAAIIKSTLYPTDMKKGYDKKS